MKFPEQFRWKNAPFGYAKRFSAARSEPLAGGAESGQDWRALDRYRGLYKLAA